MAGHILGNGMIAFLILRYQHGDKLGIILLFYSKKNQRFFNYWHSQQFVLCFYGVRSAICQEKNHESL